MPHTRSVRNSSMEYARGIAGGLLFSFPLLYTMEVWWSAFIVSPLALLLLVLVTLILLLGYNRYAGIRPDASWKEVLIDSIEEAGLGLIISFGVLWMLNRIQLDMSIDEIMSKVVIEAMMVSIGVSVGTAQLGAGNGGGKEGEDHPQENGNHKMQLLVLAICGSLIVGGNVAPTEEVMMIALEAEPFDLLIMCLFSIAMSIVISFFSDFRHSRRESNNHLIYHISFDTSVSYVAALGTSALALWFFGRFENVAFWDCFSQVIVLGVIASLGASAGRLLIK